MAQRPEEDGRWELGSLAPSERGLQSRSRWRDPAARQAGVPPRQPAPFRTLVIRTQVTPETLPRGALGVIGQRQEPLLCRMQSSLLVSKKKICGFLMRSQEERFVLSSRKGEQGRGSLGLISPEAEVH